MRFMDYIKTAFKNLRRRKARTFLTSFAISIGTMLVIVMVSMGVGAQNLILSKLKEQATVTQISVSPYKTDAVVKVNVDGDGDETEAKKNFKKLDDENIQKIKGIKNVQDISVNLNTQLSKIELDGKKKSRVMAVGMDLNYEIFPKTNVEAMREKEKNKSLEVITYGRNLQKGDKNEVIISESFLKKLGIKEYNSVVGKELSITASMPEAQGVPKVAPLSIKAKVVGVINEKYTQTDSIIMPIETAASIQAYYNFDDNFYKNQGPDSIIVSTKSVDDVKNVSSEIEKLGYGVSSFETVVKMIKSFFAVFEGILAIGGIIVIFVAAIGVVNTMTMSIYERTRSIGIMKAVGASRSSIRKIFIAESGAIGFLGGIMGLGFGWINSKILSFALNQYLKSKSIDTVQIFSMPLWLILGAIGFAVFVSIISGLLPAARASKLDPIESLRYE
jgi:putative ABC transport system permease protein